ncbi:helix-turn-helix transcriptional regulator [Streptomyces sp. BK205]|uniref:helix-turn-helix transcriptional regulator n=1 Tax=Streptomyces sp. BK205 TaxID=2512164 RepID=UPI0010433F70|nr:helix-turn-helix transcriptional regulator [Streptomyces sp. BK205]TCR22912.1 transcriptional regulator with XRE-family HTH domain [Streptomyces sp. BK205]
MNERLRSALVQRGITEEGLAELCSVDPKTVGRWLSGRVPHRRHRFVVAQHLQVDEMYLWPNGQQRPVHLEALRSEIVEVYPNRASVPRDIWISLLLGAVKHIDVLVFSGTFFAQTNPHIARMLQERARAGVKVRLCFGDPYGEAVAVRGREEGIGDTLAAKIRASLTYYRSLVGAPGCEVRLHDTTLYNSIFRYDDQLLVNPHIWGQPASANPLFQLRRTNGTDWCDRYVEGFEAVWNTARPWAPDRQEHHQRGQD